MFGTVTQVFLTIGPIVVFSLGHRVLRAASYDVYLAQYGFYMSKHRDVLLHIPPYELVQFISP